MSTSVTFNGTSYSIPSTAELNWQALSAFLIDVGTNSQTSIFQKFAVRIATTSPITVSAANDCVIISNLSVAGAVAVNFPAGVTKQMFVVVDGKGDASTNNITITPAAGNINGASTYVINVNRAGVAFIYNGTEWTVFAEFGGETSGTGSIPRNKIAAGSADHVIINDGSGFLSSEAQLSSTRGGTGVNNAGTLTIGVNNITFTTSGVTALTLPTSGTVATTSNNLGAFAATTSAQLAGVISDETGSGALVFGTSPAITTPTGIVKGDVGLGNVDNTSDATKNAATVVLTNKDYDGGTASNSNRLTVPKNTKSNLDALTRKEGTLVFATDTQSAYLDYNSTLNPLGGAGVTLTVTQATHGFTSTNIGAPLYLSGSTYVLAKADVSSTAEVVGVIDTIIDTNTFGMKESGSVTVNTAVSGGGALTAGTVYFLSASSAGQITATEPSTVGYVSKPIGVANSTTTLILTQSRGIVVGGSNARSNVSLSNNATTTVQNVSAYDAGEVTGWVVIAATTPLRFYLSAQFSKNGAASDYNVSYQTSGDTVPTGFSVTITSGGVLQIVLPSITGFTSASINYSLNAPAVGVTFPLSVASSVVTGRTDGVTQPSGFIGQTLSVTASTSIPANALTELTNTSIPAGSWLVWASAGANLAANTFTKMYVILTETAAGSYSETAANVAQDGVLLSGASLGNAGFSAATPMRIVNYATATTIRLHIETDTSAGSGASTFAGIIRAVRIA